MSDPIYTVSSTSTGGGRDGKVASDAGHVDLVMAPPTEMGGNGQGANPEELFSAGYAACFMGALRHTAKSNGHTVPDGATITVKIGIGKDAADGGFKLNADITAHLPGVDQPTATAMAEAAHAFCPYSKATRGNIEHTVTATV
ncbi:Ohr family peroxiredoxin [Gordonia sp. VNK21]|uniref:Ohr family peroxiredoxin n=1 Tax=Gordonia sp. VNK21 TaxID=3382483 RepID=UPI0038D507A9